MASIICPNCKVEISVDEALTHSIAKKYEKEKQLELAKYRSQMETWQAEREKKFELEKKTFELEKQRSLDQERKKVQEEISQILLEEHRFKDAEKDKMMLSMKKTIEELQLKANLTSQQLQGEVLELEMETALKAGFPVDDIFPVGKGISGADVLQKVRNQNGLFCGMIVWESKRTKNWTDSWILKLKEDMQKSKGDIAVLVSAVLPDEIKNFGLKDGVYVTNFDCFLAVARVLRGIIIKEQGIRASVVGKNEKMEVIYNYLSGSEFRQKIEAIIEAFSLMKQDLEQEKKVFQKLWAKREKEIDRVINNTVGMHGDLQGLMGASLPAIKGLELDSFEYIKSSDVLVEIMPDEGNKVAYEN